MTKYDEWRGWPITTYHKSGVKISHTNEKVCHATGAKIYETKIKWYTPVARFEIITQKVVLVIFHLKYDIS